MEDAVIVSAVPTPTGKFLGGLKEFKATELGAMVVREAVRRAGIDPASVDECIMGNVVSAGLGQAPARQAALRGGLADPAAGAAGVFERGQVGAERVGVGVAEARQRPQVVAAGAGRPLREAPRRDTEVGAFLRHRAGLGLPGERAQLLYAWPEVQLDDLEQPGLFDGRYGGPAFPDRLPVERGHPRV